MFKLCSFQHTLTKKDLLKRESRERELIIANRMAVDEKKSEEWKNDRFVVALRRVNFLKNDWDLLGSFYDDKEGIIPYAKANSLTEITAICKEHFKLNRIQAGEVGGALIGEYYKESGT